MVQQVTGNIKNDRNWKGIVKYRTCLWIILLLLSLYLNEQNIAILKFHNELAFIRYNCLVCETMD